MKVSVGGKIEAMVGKESLSGFSITTRETGSSPPTRRMSDAWEVGVKEILGVR